MRCLTLFHAKTQNKEIQAQDTVEAQTAEGAKTTRGKLGKSLIKMGKRLAA